MNGSNNIFAVKFVYLCLNLLQNEQNDSLGIKMAFE